MERGDKRTKRSSSVSGFVRKSLMKKKSTVNESLVHIHIDANIRDFYTGLDGSRTTELGHGNWGTVRLITRKADQRQFACKILQIDNITRSKTRLKDLRQEIVALAKLDHPHIAKLYETYEEEGRSMYLVMELLKGGELYTRLTQESRHSRYTETRARKTVKQMVSAITYLHSRGIVHRDLKLENFVYRARDSDVLVLIDFGLSKRFRASGDDGIVPRRIMHDIVGSSYYIAPEVLDRNYGPECDVWSMGVITYMLLSGRPPFGGTTEREIINNAHRGEYSMGGRLWRNVSENAKDFIRKALTKNPAQRPTAAALSEHKWLKETDREENEDCALSEEIIKNLEAFANNAEMKRVALQAVAYSMSYDEISSLHQAFEEIDTDNDGLLSYDEFKRALENHGGISEEDMQLMFEAIDVNQGGKIQITEFIAAAMGRRAVSDELVVEQAFERLKPDDQGEIRLADLSSVLAEEVSEQRAQEMMAEFMHEDPASNEPPRTTITKQEFILALRRKQTLVRARTRGDSDNTSDDETNSSIST